MSKLSQKQAVINEVLTHLPSFVKGTDSALALLSSAQIEAIKTSIFLGISNGDIEYSKDINNSSEVKTYSRSMVMNHLKKAKELNAGVRTITNSNNSTITEKSKTLLAPKGVDPDLLTEELKEIVKRLI